MLKKLSIYLVALLLVLELTFKTPLVTKTAFAATDIPLKPASIFDGIISFFSSLFTSSQPASVSTTVPIPTLIDKKTVAINTTPSTPVATIPPPPTPVTVPKSLITPGLPQTINHYITTTTSGITQSDLNAQLLGLKTTLESEINVKQPVSFGGNLNAPSNSDIQNIQNQITTVNNFTTNPSSVIIAGTGLSWSGNTLNATGGGGGGLTNNGTGQCAIALGFNSTATGCCSSAFGFSNTASGNRSTAFGSYNIALGDDSSASGFYNSASGYRSSSFGYGNTATCCFSSAFGYSNTTSCDRSSAFGYHNTASGYRSSAFGLYNTASGCYSSASGSYNSASGYLSSAFGSNNTASGAYSSASGYHNTASCDHSSAFGSNINNSTGNSVEIGADDNDKLQISSAGVNFCTGGSGTFCVNGTPVGGGDVNNLGPIEVGNSNTATGAYSTASGYNNTACGCYDQAIGGCNIASGSSYGPYLYSSAVAIGFKNNATASGYFGAGASAIGVCNTVSGYSSTASGYGNTASGSCFSDAFGTENSASSQNSSAFGSHNTASGYRSSAFGFANTTSATNSVAFGSFINNITANSVEIGADDSNKLQISDNGVNFCTGGSGTFCVNGTPVGGGDVNNLGPIEVGNSNIASGAQSSALGYNNTANAGFTSATAVGYSNTASGYQFSSAFGAQNTASGYRYSSAFGACNTASGSYSSASGYNNSASGYAADAFGSNDVACGDFSAAFGFSDHATATHSSSFGWGNYANGSYSSASGFNNFACTRGTTASGYCNTASGNYSSAIGFENTSSGASSSAFGNQNTTSACFAAAFGTALTNSTAFSTMLGYGTHYLRVNNNDSVLFSNGACLSAGGTFTNNSDRNLKENFTDLDSASILSDINSLPITEWNYKTEGSSVKHIGPVAQDFYSIFNVGNASTSISTIDPAGIALIGIQELSKEVTALQQAIGTSTLNDIVFTNNFLTSSISTSTDQSLLASTFNDFVTGIKNWAAGEISAVTGYFKNIFAQNVTGKNITGENVNAQTLCVGTVCVTQDQLNALLQYAHVSTTTQSASPVLSGSISSDNSISSSSNNTSSTTPDISNSTTTPHNSISSSEATSTPDISTTIPEVIITTPEASSTPVVTPPDPTPPVPISASTPDSGTASTTSQ